MGPDSDLDALLDGFRRKGFAFALRILGNADDAADAVQESLSILWAHRRRVKCGQDPVAWFFRTLRNHCIDKLRQRRSRRRKPIGMAELADSRDARPDVVAQRDEFRTRLAQELQDLDLPYREVLILRDYQGLSYAQIAAVLAIPQGTVMSRLHRARMRLRERLKDLL